jgi:hypothetical protein
MDKDGGIEKNKNNWYDGPGGYKCWADWHDKNYPTDFKKACDDSRKRQEYGRKQIEARLAVQKL